MRPIVVAVLCALSASVAIAKEGNECIVAAGTVAPVSENTSASLNERFFDCRVSASRPSVTFPLSAAFFGSCNPVVIDVCFFPTT